MAYIPPSMLSEGQVRFMMGWGVLVCLPSGVGLMVSQPLSGFTVLGAGFFAAGVWFVRMWWPPLSPLTQSTGRSRRLELIGAVLAAVSAVLLGLGAWLYFNTSPGHGWSIAVGSAGIACLLGRFAVGIQRLLLHRRVEVKPVRT
ncbi:hypothetical protein ABZ840_00085 [Streptomyces sp. NPDC047117]|uniref:hypothetical protein n=1 Tax=Streptomyces sp. NPDC047117 TaxID=3155379 RepID=UPI0033E1BAF4